MARLTNHDMQLRLQRTGLRVLLETSPVFRKFIFTLLTDAAIFYPTYQLGSPHGTSYHEGRRSLGLEVLHQLKNACPGFLGLIEREGDLLATEAAPPPGDSNDDQTPDDDD